MRRLHDETMSKTLSFVLLLASFLHVPSASACEGAVAVCARDAKGSFVLIRGGEPAFVYVDAAADPAVRHAARNFVEDLGRVGARPAALLTDAARAGRQLVIIGVLGGARCSTTWRGAAS
jgi:hypothetical protein